MTLPLHTRRRWEVRNEDCLTVLPRLDTSTVDAIVTDPPYGININSMKWDSPRQLDPLRPPARRRSRANPRVAFQRFCTDWTSQCLRVLKPGAHIAAFSATRTVHLLACALEDAGFELRDMLVWLHGNGYPGPQPVKGGLAPRLKPALEPILLARKPFGGTLGSNLSTYGTGALNIDATRIINHDESCPHSGRTYRQRGAVSPKGRWPANLILSHGSRCRPTQCQRDCPVDLLGTHHRFFYCPKAAQGEREAGCERLPRRTIQTYRVGAASMRMARTRPVANVHPTVKPLDLMRWLVRLLTPPRQGTGAIVLDPFAGSGSTGIAVILEGARFLGIERDQAYAAIARARIRHWARSTERRSQ
jgi:DNA modification methylase